MKKLPRNEILSLLEERLARRGEIIFAYVFGLLSQGDEFNDIDVAVYLSDEGRLTTDRWYDIRLALELETATGYSVDVVLLNRAPDHLIHEISKGRVIKDCDEEFRIDFITRAWSRYFDFQPKRREYIQQIVEE